MILNVGAVQLRCGQSIEQNVNSICQAIAKCGALQTDVVCFPEAAVVGFDTDMVRGNEAEILAGLERIRGAAADAGCYAVVGTPTFEGDAVYNSAIVIDPSGDDVCTYSKVQEEGFFSPGNSIALCEIKGVLCTIVICRDLWHPELLRIAAMKGARLAFVPHACGGHADSLFRLSENANHVFRTVAGVRAHENAIFIVLADLVGSYANGRQHSPGISQILHPEGVALAKATPYQEDIITARIDVTDRTEDFAARARDQLFLSKLWESVLDAADGLLVPAPERANGQKLHLRKRAVGGW